MNDVLLRIRKIFNDSGKSQTAIGKSISKTSQYIWRLLNLDDVNPSDSVIKDICREFNVREEWLRYGEEPIYKDGFFSELLAEIDSSDDTFIKELLYAYMELDDSSKKALQKLANNMLNKRKERD